MRTSEVYNEDCVIGMARYQDKYFDLAVVDPPYGIGVNKMTLGNGNRKLNRGLSNWDKNSPDILYFEEIQRVSKNQIIWGANHFISKIPIDSSCWIFWDKGTGSNDFADGELAWTSFNTTVRKYFKSWVGANAREPTEFDRIHPTQKPIALYDWIYKNYLPKGGKVIDTHLGSGSNRIAADRAGNVDFVAFEIDKDYFEAQEKRFKIYKSQTKLF